MCKHFNVGTVAWHMIVPQYVYIEYDYDYD